MPGSPPSEVGVTQPTSGNPEASLTGLPAPRGEMVVVGIGASAGGLDACQKLLEALPPRTGMAWILVQHLDPTHESMMAELLAAHTSMTVCEAAEGMLLEPEHLYVIVPDAYLSVAQGVLRLTRPQARHGARLPFDYLLHSLAQEYGDRAACVILSGTGADGSLGLMSVKARGGFVIAQDPDEAAYGGMPRSAIQTNAVDLVLPVERIPASLLPHRDRSCAQSATTDVPAEGAAGYGEPAWLAEVIQLLLTRTAYDFTLYKHGTLRRRVERRRAMAGIDPGDMDRYLAMLRHDAGELDLLAKDLLINVTRFFRDPEVFDFLAERIVPGLIGHASPGRAIRVWVAACSTGEETYSLAMLLREKMASAACNIELQVFASDIDADAVASAREGLYPATIEADVSPARLARFFSREERGYRVLPELRASIVFTVHDVLVNPPFSQLDLVSCRNLLIYLNPAAQAKVVSQFDFALRDGGVLLIGNAETLLNADARFEIISRPERVYRHIARNHSRHAALSVNPGDATRLQPQSGPRPGPARRSSVADVARSRLLDTYAPAAVLVNRNHECLYFFGSTAPYLHVPAGQPTHDVLALAPKELRTRLRSAIQHATRTNARVVVAGGTVNEAGHAVPFDLDVQPVSSDGEDLLLICFVAAPRGGEQLPASIAPRDLPRVAALEHELEATKTELEDAIRSLEISGEDQKAINEEALSINEEYQSTNEELLTSKEELQSLNEELTALNGQLQETLERQRTTSNDLQNVLYSTNVATLFLDTHLNIRFFTPATRLFFSVIPGDIGRPLADLSSLASDGNLLADARTVLQTSALVEREIEAQSGIWFIRRILPYRTDDNGVEGVVITFTDVTERKLAAKALEAAKLHADQANTAKSRFLAAASHDLRQPLQTLALLQGALAKMVEGDEAQSLIARLDQTLGAMSGMLNTLLDINQIESGTVRAERVRFPIADLLDRMRDEFSYHAEAHGLGLRVAPCGLAVQSDPRLLAQVIRNLLSNALKYTRRGKVLLGCRRRAHMLRIEIWDTGIGIPGEELEAIFHEYHQLDNAARERSRGLGLGLSIAQRLAELLGSRISVRSHPGKGSVFAIEVALAGTEAHAVAAADSPEGTSGRTHDTRRSGSILVIEDDPDVSDLIVRLLDDEGHRTMRASSGTEVLARVAGGMRCPDLILADYNLPQGMNGLELATKLRATFQCDIPAIILTGDISTATWLAVARQPCLQLNKPVKARELLSAIESLLAVAPAAAGAHAPAAGSLIETGNAREEPALVYVVDDDRYIRDGVRAVLEGEGHTVEDFDSCEAFLEAYRPGRDACLLIDAYLPGMSGLDLLQRLRDAGDSTARDHGDGQQRRARGSPGDEGRRLGLHRKADRTGRIDRERRAGVRAVDGFTQAGRMAGRGRASHRGSHAASAADHGPGARRPSEQDHCRRSRHQPAHG